MSRLNILGPGPGYFRGAPPPPDPFVINKMQSEREAAADARKAAIEAARDERQTYHASYLSAQQAAQQYDLAQQHAQTQGQLANQAAFHQAGRDYRMAGIEQQQAEQHVDLQGRLNAVQLGHQEEMRMQRMKQGIDGVSADPNLSPEEKQQLITQLRTGLNPLENRQRESQMLFQHIQSQALEQQNQQQATLFSQRQAHIARGIQQNVQYIEDPQTGIRQPFFVDHNGNPTELNFPMMQQQHEMRMAQGQQSMQIQAAMAPGEYQLLNHRVSHAGMSNEELSQQIAFNRDANPYRLQSLRTEVDTRLQQLQAARQQYTQREQMYPLELQREEAHLQAMRQTFDQSADTHPLTMEGMRGRNALQPGQLQAQNLNNQAAQGAMDFHNRPLDQRVRTIYSPEERAAAETHAMGQLEANNAEPGDYQQLVDQHLQANGSPIHMFEHAPGQFRFEQHLNDNLTSNQVRLLRTSVTHEVNQQLRRYQAAPTSIIGPDGRHQIVQPPRPHWLDRSLLPEQTGAAGAALRMARAAGREPDLTPQETQQLLDQEVERQLGPHGQGRRQAGAASQGGMEQRPVPQPANQPPIQDAIRNALNANRPAPVLPAPAQNNAQGQQLMARAAQRDRAIAHMARSLNTFPHNILHGPQQAREQAQRWFDNGTPAQQAQFIREAEAAGGQ